MPYDVKDMHDAILDLYTAMLAFFACEIKGGTPSTNSPSNQAMKSMAPESLDLKDLQKPIICEKREIDGQSFKDTVIALFGTEVKNKTLSEQLRVSIRQMNDNRMNASVVSGSRSYSRLRRRSKDSQAKLRSTIQRFLTTTKLR